MDKKQLVHLQKNMLYKKNVIKTINNIEPDENGDISMSISWDMVEGKPVKETIQDVVILDRTDEDPEFWDCIYPGNIRPYAGQMVRYKFIINEGLEDIYPEQTLEGTGEITQTESGILQLDIIPPSFSILFYDDEFIITEEIGISTLTAEVTLLNVVVTTIDEKYLPNIPSNWDTMINRPFGEEISETIIMETPEDWNGTDQFNGEYVEEIMPIRVYYSGEFGNAVIDIENADLGMGVSVKDEAKNIDFEICIGIPGTYAVMYLNDSDYLTYLKVVSVETDLKTINPKYLPNTLVKSVNNITPDENGNIELEISGGDTGGVKSVNNIQPDENGNVNIEFNPTPESIGAAPVSHNHDVSNITSGVLPVDRGGTGYDSITDTRYTDMRYRASSLNNSEPELTINGAIAWIYE